MSGEGAREGEVGETAVGVSRTERIAKRRDPTKAGTANVHPVQVMKSVLISIGLARSESTRTAGSERSARLCGGDPIRKRRRTAEGKVRRSHYEHKEQLDPDGRDELGRLAKCDAHLGTATRRAVRLRALLSTPTLARVAQPKVVHKLFGELLCGGNLLRAARRRATVRLELPRREQLRQRVRSAL